MKDYRELVNQQRHRVFTYAFYTLRDQDEAEDTVQEVFVRLWQHWNEIDETAVSAWLIRVTRNACIDRIRRGRAYSLRVAAAGTDTVVFEGVSSEPEPDAVVEAMELREQIQVALTRIEEPYRSLIILREIQDLTYDEIAHAMELPLNTVKSYLHRGRKMLRKELKEIFNLDRV